MPVQSFDSSLEFSVESFVNDWNFRVKTISLQNFSSLAGVAVLPASVRKRFHIQAINPCPQLNTMDYSRAFSSNEVVSWLRAHKFSSETSERLGNLQ